MKKLFFEKAYQPFLLTALISLCIALFFKGVFPGSYFDISIINTDIDIATSRIWFWFSGYLFFLAFTYYLINLKALKSKKWLVVSHYVFIVLFLAFFIAFSSFSNPDIQKLVIGIPFSTLIMLYSALFLIDIMFFIIGFLFLIFNLVSVNRANSK